jgi:ribosomal protein S18 acetylase RimI-like enzyme
MKATQLEIRPIGTDERDQAWRVLSELRSHLDKGRFVADLTDLVETHDYELIGAFETRRLVGVLGMRIVRTFARGAHLHVDDLVVASDARGRGIGRELLRYAESLARERGLEQVFLDTRPGALGFYEREGYRQHESVLIKKRLCDD